MASDQSPSVDLDKVLTFAKSEMLLKGRTRSAHEIKTDVVYDLSSSNTKWNKGYTTLFVGLRQKKFSQGEFLKHLTQHVHDVSSNFKNGGLKGYIFSATGDYEIAWQNWTSKSAADQAFQSTEGKRIVQDAMFFMENGFYKPMNWETKNPIRVLMVMTSHEDLGTTGLKTGFYLSEVTHPYYKIAEAGIDVDFASPKGGEAPMDKHSKSEEDSENKKFLADQNLVARLDSTLKLADIDAKNYSAILFTGGHGTMWDFPNSEAVLNITKQIYENGGIVSAVCHGPAALVNIKLSNGKLLIHNRKLTAFTNGEESAVKLQDVVPFSLESMLTKNGAKFKGAKNWTPNVIVDGRLITGQNPQSASQLGEKIVEALTY